jgi:hypothetical protein
MTDEPSVEPRAGRVPIIVDVELHPRFLGLPGVYDRPSLGGTRAQGEGCTCRCGSESGAGSGAG